MTGPLPFAAVLAVVGFAGFRLARLLVVDDLLDGPRRWLLARCPPTGTARTDVVPNVPAGRVSSWRHKTGDLLSCPHCVGWWSTGLMLAAAHAVRFAVWPLRWDLVGWWAAAGLQSLLSTIADL